MSSGYQNAIYAMLPMQALGAGLVLMPSAVVNESSDTLLFHDDDRQIDKRMVRPFGFVEVQVQEFSNGGM